MTDQEVQEQLLDKEITLTFTVGAINQLLNDLGQLPFSVAVHHINNIQAQGTPQVTKLGNEIIEAAKAQDPSVVTDVEPKAVAE